MLLKCCLGLGLLLLLTAAAGAAPPTLDAISPPGGQRGQITEVTIAGAFDSWPIQVAVDGKGVEAKAAKSKGKFLVTVAADALPGTYWLRLYDEQGASVVRPFLVGMLPEVQEKEPNDDPKNANVIDSPNATINGKLEKDGDVDVFAVDLKKGQTLVASVDANRTLKSPMDGVLQVLNADGFVLAQNDDFRGFDPQIVFTARQDGRHLIRLFAFPSEPNASIKFAGGLKFVYRLTLTTAGFADYAFPLGVPRASPGEVDVIGWNLAKKKVAVIPDSHGDFGTAFDAQWANAVRVRLEPHATAVRMNTNPQPIKLPITVTARLTRRGDIHVYEFPAKKGQKVALSIDTRTLGFPMDPVLKVTDAAGKVFVRMESKGLNNDVALDFNPLANGVYRIEVQDFHGEGGPRYVYRLQAIFAEPDFSLQVAGDRFAVTPGKPVEIPVSISRRHGHKQDIEFTAHGLPKGITVQPVVASPGKDIVNLRLTGEGEPISGSFKIVGTVKGNAEPPHVARAPVAEYGQMTAHLWLTFGPKAAAPKDTPNKKKK